uniref:Tyrosine-protein kinase n=1 Tax=Panagrellus redivivus TaxID=6233 RepID=A0A7E4UXV2_PANRE
MTKDKETSNKSRESARSRSSSKNRSTVASPSSTTNTLMQAPSEALPPHESFENERWWHGMLPREDIVGLLEKPGQFLVRLTEPTKGKGMKLVLSVRIPTKHHHFVIYKDTNNMYCIEKYKFATVSELINFYVSTKKCITKKSGAVLISPVPRQDWEIRHSQIELGKELGRGAFGSVCIGTFTQNNGTVKNVAVKVNQGKALNKEIIQMICKEARTMRRYRHKNIVNFYGVAVEQEPILLVMELVNDGALDSYLKKNFDSLSIGDLALMCADAANGIEYLHSKLCIHRDVAARNCLVSDARVKISDFGLTRDVSDKVKQYKIKNLKQKLPIRWLAPETLITATYTYKSDVFSFGILLWEVFTGCVSEPYPGLTAAEVNAKVKQGYRMDPPSTMPLTIADIMSEHCFPGAPEDRWEMTQIRKTLEEIANQSSFDRKKTKDKELANDFTRIMDVDPAKAREADLKAEREEREVKKEKKSDKDEEKEEEKEKDSEKRKVEKESEKRKKEKA